MRKSYWRATLTRPDGRTAANIDLTLSIPADLRSGVEVRLRTGSEGFADLLGIGVGNEIAIRGVQRDDDGDISAELIVERAHLESISEETRGGAHRSWTCLVYTQDVVEWRIYETPGFPLRTIVFIDDHDSLTPSRHDRLNADGSITGHQVPSDLKVMIPILDDSELEFVRGFSWHSERSTVTRVESAIGEIRGVYIGTDESQRMRVFREIDDFLLLVGLATGRYCQCLGLTSTNEREAMEVYRRSDLFSEGPKERAWDQDSLIRAENFVEYCGASHRAFRASRFQNEIRSCLYALRAADHSFLELSFLGLFSSLELLLSRYREVETGHHIIDVRAFSAVQERLKNEIRDSRLFNDWQRADVYANLAGITRIPLRTTYASFVDHIGADVSELWPLFAESGIGISTLRNMIVHGDPASRLAEFSRPLSLATRHLQWTLEVILLSMLSWPRAKSSRRSDALKVLFPSAADPASIAECEFQIKQLRE